MRQTCAPVNLICMNDTPEHNKADKAEPLPAQPLNIMFSLYYESGEDMEEAAAPPPEKACEPPEAPCTALLRRYNGAA